MKLTKYLFGLTTLSLIPLSVISCSHNKVENKEKETKEEDDKVVDDIITPNKTSETKEDHTTESNPDDLTPAGVKDLKPGSDEKMIWIMVKENALKLKQKVRSYGINEWYELDKEDDFPEFKKEWKVKMQKQVRLIDKFVNVSLINAIKEKPFVKMKIDERTKNFNEQIDSRGRILQKAIMEYFNTLHRYKEGK